ncbi:MAG: head GIN domain-containing protein [Bacteroidota bacterium]
MKRSTLSLVLLLCFAVMANAQFGKKKNYDAGGMDADIRDLPPFQSISVSSGVDVYITQADEQLVQVVSPDLDPARVITEVKNGVLHIRTKKKGYFNFNFETPKVNIEVADLEAIRASSGSDIYTTATFRTDALRIDGSGGSDLRLELEVDELVAHTSGGSDLYLSGTTKLLEIYCSGGSDIQAYKLKATNCRVDSSGGSDAYVHVDGELRISASGASDVHVRGKAKVISKEASGSSDIFFN